jgi:hypothetical protein
MVRQPKVSFPALATAVIIAVCATFSLASPHPQHFASPHTVSTGVLKCQVKREQTGRLFADTHLTDYVSGRLLMAKTNHGKIYAVWRLDAPPGYVATQYPIKIVVNSPKTLPVLLRVDFGPAGFTGFGVTLNGQRAHFQPAVLGRDWYMWLPGGRNVVEYGIS